jgi:hypothetical protein
MSGSINIGHLYKKRTIRNLNGSIKYMEDEANGGVLIRNGHVVNQQRIDELAKIEEDRRNSATAFANPVVAPNPAITEERNVTPTKVEKLETDVAELKDNIAQILNLLQKK